MWVLLRRAVLTLVVAEVAYLALANLALNLPATQEWINSRNPEKILVSWERAWTWLPFRVHATGIVANGQSWSAQWQAQAASASAGVALLPLFDKTVRVTGLDAENLAVFVRPKVRPDRKQGLNRLFFPIIPGRDPDAVAGEPPTRAPGWKIVIADGHAHGNHTFWASQIRGAVSGPFRVTVTNQTRAGPLTLSDGRADMTLQSLTINGVRVVNGGRLSGTFSMGPFIPPENRGIKAFGFLRVNAEIDASVASIAFLNYYLKDLNGMTVAGRGRVQGRIRYANGDLTAGTDVAVLAEELVLDAGPYKVTGDGRIDFDVDAAAPEDLHLAVRFGDLQAVYEPDPDPLVVGKNLEVLFDGPTRVLPGGPGVLRRERIQVTLPSVTAPDLRAYQRYLPEKWGLRVTGGSGVLSGRADISADAMSADLTLKSRNAELAFGDYEFESDLDMGLTIAGKVEGGAAVDVSGSYIRLDQARLRGESRGSSKAWKAHLTVNDGDVSFNLADTDEPDAVADGFLGLIRRQEFKAIVGSANAWLDAHISVSDLGWINVLFKNPFALTIFGSGEVAADIKMISGWLATGTTLAVQPRDFQVELLDYVAEGNGSFSIAVEKGGDRPDLRLDAGVRGGALRRRDETRAFIEQVRLDVTARAKELSLSDQDSDRVTAVDVSMPSAKVTDMTVYNQYLPRGSPIRLTSGQADISAKMHMEPESANGYLRLETSQLASRLDDSSLSGKLTLDINVRDGVPSKMAFDIAGSSLRLDSVTVTGSTARIAHPGWGASLDLRKGNVVWKKPMRLDLDATLFMQDTRPLVAILANERQRHRFIDNLITVDGVRGEARLTVDANRIVVPYSFATGGKIEVGTKGVIDGDEREGMFYVRYGKIGAVLQLFNGRRKFDLFGARRIFDAYRPGATPVTAGGSAARGGQGGSTSYSLLQRRQ